MVFFYAHHQKLIHPKTSPSLAAPKIGPKRRTNHRAQSASRDVALASKSLPRRAKTTSSLVSRARRGNHPSDLSLASIFRQKVRAFRKKKSHKLSHFNIREKTLHVTHHFFLTVRGEHRGRRRALRVRHRRRHSHIIRSGRRRRRLRFQVAFERLLVKGFRERHFVMDDDDDVL